MFDPYLDARFDSKAFPPLARAISLVFSTAVVGAVLLEAFLTAAAIVA